MAKAQLTEEEKKEQRAQETERRNRAVMKQIVNLSKRPAEQRKEMLEAITHALPMKMLNELVEEKVIKQDYLDWLKEECPHIIRKAGSGGGKREKVVREYPSWIDNVDDAPKKLIDAGKDFHNALKEFEENQNENLEYFREEYGEDWKHYFRLVKNDE